MFNVDGFSWVTDEPVCDILGRAVFVGDMGVHSRGDGSRVRMSQVDEIVSWRERRLSFVRTVLSHRQNF